MKKDPSDRQEKSEHCRVALKLAQSSSMPTLEKNQVGTEMGSRRITDHLCDNKLDLSKLHDLRC